MLKRNMRKGLTSVEWALIATLFFIIGFSFYNTVIAPYNY